MAMFFRHSPPPKRGHDPTEAPALRGGYGLVVHPDAVGGLVVVDDPAVLFLLEERVQPQVHTFQTLDVVHQRLDGRSGIEVAPFFVRQRTTRRCC